MPEDVRVWEILHGDSLKEIRKSKLDLEERVEKWLQDAITIVSNDLLVIGRQVATDFGGVIDLLCLERDGDIVIVELKRDKTPREITAQVLDYASWVIDLSNERITEIANEYLGAHGPLEEAFRRKFGDDLPEILNEHHQMLIVASQIDSSSERIIRYLSDNYGVGINAITFHYFQNEEGKEFLARVFLIEPSQVEYSVQTKAGSKRKPPLSFEELQRLAEENGAGELYKHLAEGLLDLFDQRITTRSTVGFVGIRGDNRNVIFSLVPGESNAEDGLRFQVYVPRLTEYFGLDVETVSTLLPQNREDWQYSKDAPGDMRGYTGFFATAEETDRFIAGLKQSKPHKRI